VVGDVAAVPTAVVAVVAVVVVVVDVDVDVVEGGDGAFKHSLLNPPACTCINGCFSRIFFTIVRHQSFTPKMSGYTPINVVSSPLSCNRCATSCRSSRTLLV
jgi:hypothetical protein